MDLPNIMTDKTVDTYSFMEDMKIEMIKANPDFDTSMFSFKNPFDTYTHKGAVEVGRFFWLTSIISLASASFGIAKFIKSGPASIVRNDKWLDGFGTFTFSLLFFNILFTLLVKAIAMGFIVVLLSGGDIISMPILSLLLINLTEKWGGEIEEILQILVPVLWVLLFLLFLPQCLHVSIRKDISI